MRSLRSAPMLLAALFGMLAFHTTTARAQTPEEEVRAVIDGLFDAMRAGDSAAVRSVFHPTASMASVFSRAGAPAMQYGSVDQFVEAVGTPHGEVWDEHIWNVRIDVDGHLASAWMDYAFYRGETFSHCGVNSFQLFRTVEGWKTIYIVDTRRRDGCELPAER